MDSGYGAALAAYIGARIIVLIVVCVGIGFLISWLVT